MSIFIKELSLSKTLTAEDKNWKKHIHDFGDYKASEKCFDDLMIYGKVLEEHAYSAHNDSIEDQLNFLKQARTYYQLVLKNQQDKQANEGLVRVDAALYAADHLLD